MGYKHQAIIKIIYEYMPYENCMHGKGVVAEWVKTSPAVLKAHLDTASIPGCSTSDQDPW